MPQSIVDILPVQIGDTLLRSFAAKDVDAFHAYRSDSELARYQGWDVMSYQQATDFVQGVCNLTSLPPGEWVQLALADPVTDQLLGDIGLFTDPHQHFAELGFTLAAQYHGLGHASRGVQGAISLLKQATPVSEVRAITDARNSASIQVLERTGFVKVDERKTIFKNAPCVEFHYLLSLAR